MSVAVPNQALESTVETDVDDKTENLLPPSITFGPQTWSFLYWGILISSVTVGCLTLLSGGSIASAIIRFFLMLLGTAFLGIVFLSSVVMPLHIKSYQALQKQAQEEAERRQAEARKAREEQEAMFSSKFSTAPVPAQPQPELVQGGESEVVRAATRQIEEALDQADELRGEGVHMSEIPVDDQASGLRRMVGAAG